MQKYRFQLTPANRHASIDFAAIEQESRLLTAAAEGCNSGPSFTRSGKTLTIEKIDGKRIVLTLTSQTPLTNPSRALYGFSRELMRLDKDSGVLKECIQNHALFRIRPLENPNPNPLSPLDISDSTLLKAIIDLLFNSGFAQNDPRRESMILQLKSLLLPYIIDAEQAGKNEGK